MFRRLGPFRKPNAPVPTKHPVYVFFCQLYTCLYIFTHVYVYTCVYTFLLVFYISHMFVLFYIFTCVAFLHVPISTFSHVFFISFSFIVFLHFLHSHIFTCFKSFLLFHNLYILFFHLVRRGAWQTVLLLPTPSLLLPSSPPTMSG